ncbi:hypothetical protein ScPMuIL_015743 [Solemya velum]
MASLKGELDKFLNPTPSFQDPEDDLADLSTAKLVDKSADTQPSEVINEPSRLRRKAVLGVLSDFDEKYSGKKISRKKLRHSLSTDDGDDAKTANLNLLFDVDEGKGKVSSDSEDLSSDDGDENDEIQDFKSKLNLSLQNKKTSQEEFSFEDDGDYTKYADDDVENDVSGDEEESDEEEEDRIDEEGDVSDEDGGVKSFSKSNLHEEVAKGNAARQQLGLWDNLLETRIKLQKVLPLVNQLPQPDIWQSFQHRLGDDFSQSTRDATNALKTALDKMMQLQTVLLLQNGDTEHVVTGKDAQGPGSKEDDEEIPSDSDADAEEPLHSDKDALSKAGMKRKLKLSEYPEFLSKRHKDFNEFRNNSIQKWYDKTRLAGGKVKSKSFDAFEQSALKQIEQILTDRSRLVKRTQLKRTSYRVLGREEKTEETPSELELTEKADSRLSSEHLKTYDLEIFDDDDFYHQLLRELIERKTSDMNDPVALSRQWLEIQKLRSKVKKKVDTRASKGRKIRYDIHPKLVNFMASEEGHLWSDESRNDLFKSLFGHRFQSRASDISITQS